MKTRIAFLHIALFVSFVLLGVSDARATKPAYLWAQGFGGTSTDILESMAMDNSGNLYITGYFYNTINFGGSDLVSNGQADIFVAKFTSTGVHVWSHNYGGTGVDIATGIAVSGTGVYVTGDMTGTVNFGGTDQISAGGDDIFVFKLNSGGIHQWSTHYGSTGLDAGESIAADPAGNVLATGFFTGTVSFGGAGLVSAGGFDIFVAKYSSTGVHTWSKRFGSTGDDIGRALATDASSNVTFTGDFDNTVNFGGSNLVSAGGSDIYVTKLNSSGTHVWSHSYGSSSDGERGLGVATNLVGNVVLTGSFAGTVNFGTGSLVSAGNLDVFLVRFTSGGTVQWSKRFGGTTTDEGEGVAIDAADNTLLTGYFVGPANFGSGNLTNTSQDLFLAKYDAAGNNRWAGNYGGTASDEGFCVAADAVGDVYVGGAFSGLSASFGGPPIIPNGNYDAVLAKYGTTCAEAVIQSITDIGNDQGGKVKVVFAASGHDRTDSPYPPVRYEAYRRSDAPPSAVVTAQNSSRRQLLDSGWTEVGAVDPHGRSQYSIDAPTIGDSTAALGMYRSVFFIRTATDDIFNFFDSPPDSGYSVDNLAPGIPGSFAFTAGGLTWNQSVAKDFDYFTVYGSNTNSFGSATLVNYTVSTNMNVNASPYVYYFVTATDFSGNEGKPAIVNTLSGVGGTPQSFVLSVANYPNPFNPETTVKYTVPSRGLVTVAVYDATGARVRTLFRGERNAGAYEMRWDGRADNGATVGSGVYFARIEQNGSVRTKKMVLLK